MSNRISQDEDSVEDEVSKAKASIHSDEASEEETEGEEDEEDENTVPLSRPHQLVRSQVFSFIFLPITHLCRPHSIHPKSHVSQPPPFNHISG